MSKELPYFKFFPNEWITGDITLQSMEVQGLFINVCCTYWSKECRVAMAGLKQRYGEAITTLLESGLIKEKGSFAVINFLDEQWVELYNRHQKNVENGVKGAEKKWGKNSHPLAYRRDKIRKEEKIIDKKRTPEQSSGLHQSLIKLYFEWHEKKIGIKPQFDGSDGTALKQIIKYFESLESGEENVIKNFSALLSNFDKWDKFHKGQTRLRQINSNLTNIINLLKNGKSITRNGITKEGLVDAFKKRTQPTDVDNSTGRKIDIGEHNT